MAKKQKEVATGGMKKSREESFGSDCGTRSVGGGEMHLFGHTVHDGVWPAMATSVDQKTGYPKNFDGKTKSIRP
jgi:hypothetical protein